MSNKPFIVFEDFPIINITQIVSVHRSYNWFHFGTPYNLSFRMADGHYIYWWFREEAEVNVVWKKVQVVFDKYEMPNQNVTFPSYPISFSRW